VAGNPVEAFQRFAERLRRGICEYQQNIDKPFELARKSKESCTSSPMDHHRKGPADLLRSGLGIYLAEINATPLLTADEERALAHRILQGDPAARDQMVRANLRLVVSLARGYLGRGLSFEDLIAEGNLGLVRAVDGFDPSMNTRLSTYASYWIKQSMRRAVFNAGRTVRIPAYLNELLYKWRQADRFLEDKLGRRPTREETADHLGISGRKLAVIDKAIRIYNAKHQSAGPDWEFGKDQCLADNAQQPLPKMAHAEELTRAVGLLDRLNEREANVLRMRFGFNGQEPMTLEAIGNCLGLTRERTRQIENKALGKLGTYMGIKSDGNWKTATILSATRWAWSTSAHKNAAQ
jgi:RNA polymerase primary sigma factor